MMKIHIAPGRKISEVQHDFNQEYPYLKLEFFDHKKHTLKGHKESLPLPGAILLEKCQQNQKEGLLQFDGKTSVKELEKQFRDNFQLQAQVFRRSGNIWLETTLTDQWTLEKQNEHGKELSQKQEQTPEEDFDLTRDSD